MYYQAIHTSLSAATTYGIKSLTKATLDKWVQDNLKPKQIQCKLRENGVQEILTSRQISNRNAVLKKH